MKAHQTAKMARGFNVVVLLLVFGLLEGCGGNSKKRENDPVNRRGQDLKSNGTALEIHTLGLSADGVRIAYISGKGGFAKALTTNLAIGASTATPATALSTNGAVVGGVRLSEQSVRLAPNGKHALIVVAVDDRLQSLYYCDVDSPGTDPVLVHGNTSGFSNLLFSTDSKLFAYSVVISTSAPANVTYVGQVSTPAAKQQATPSISDELPEAFLNAAEPYKLLVSNIDSGTGKRLIARIEFTIAQIADLGGLTRTTVTKEMIRVQNSSLSISAPDKAFFIAPVSEKEIRITGNASILSTSIDPETYTRVLGTIQSLDLGTGTIETVSELPLGHEPKQVAFSLANDFGIYNTRVGFRCRDSGDGHDLEKTFGTGLVLMTNAGKKRAWSLPRRNKSTRTWDVTADFCTSGSAYDLDTTVNSAALNTDATEKTFRVIYVSTLDGPPQVFALDSVNDTISVLAL